MGFDEETLREPTLQDLASSEDDARDVPSLRLVYDGATRAVATRVLRLPAPVTALGRAPDAPAHIALEDDARVSRRHAQLLVDRERRVVRLLNESKNGTRVNGRRVHDAIDLEDNDVVRVGDTLLVLRWERDDVEDGPAGDLLGVAPDIVDLRGMVRLAAPTGSTVLVLGETGAGKEVVARAIHEASGRSGAFVAVNCGAIPEALAESQLFGHSAGAFTGATREHPGFFRAAQGGTLFLDEVGELSTVLQPKLLRALDAAEVLPVGASAPVKVDVRVVAATNRPLRRDVDEGRFRADLYARLAEITLEVPPLRERREDVLTLVSRALSDGAPPLTPDLAEALLLHAWPFNVREAVKLAAELRVKGASHDRLGLRLVLGRLSLPPGVHEEASRPSTPDGEARPAPPRVVTRAEPLPAPSRQDLESLLKQHQGNISRVARATGRSRTQVYRWVEQHGLDATAFREG